MQPLPLIGSKILIINAGMTNSGRNSEGHIITVVKHNRGSADGFYGVSNLKFNEQTSRNNTCGCTYRDEWYVDGCTGFFRLAEVKFDIGITPAIALFIGGEYDV